MTSTAVPAANVAPESRRSIDRGAMLFDAALFAPPDEQLFDTASWQRQGSVEIAAGGRGTVAFLRGGSRHWVLRRYRRGGAVASLLGDRYLWTGEDRTRAFREWRLLRQLAAWRLPVPIAIAARYRRSGLCYRAELLTEELPTRLTVARALRDQPLPAADWRAIGECVQRFHTHGVHHADLNAHNILLGDAHQVFVLDFDRGRLRRRGRWEWDVLARLERSLRKVTRDLPGDRFGTAEWNAVLAGYGPG